MHEKVPLLILTAVVVVSILGFYQVYNAETTANIALKIGGQEFVQSRGLAYSQPVMLCERLIGEGKIPKGYSYEAIYSEMVNRFGADHCYDGTAEVGYWCCDPTVLGEYY